jgi:hypothetical protein
MSELKKVTFYLKPEQIKDIHRIAVANCCPTFEAVQILLDFFLKRDLGSNDE